MPIEQLALKDPQHPTRAMAGVLAIVFGLSGMAALVYQVAWQRILTLHSGVGIYSVAFIVAAFIAGLGIGSLVGGRLSSGLSSFRSLLAFAIIELMVGGWALLSELLYYRGLSSWIRSTSGFGSMEAFYFFVALFVPTCLMGMSLPILSQAAINDLRTAGRTISLLYGTNIFGASLGSFLTPWFFIRLYGIDGAIRIGAAANFVAAALTFCMWMIWRKSFSSDSIQAWHKLETENTSEAARTTSNYHLWFWLLLFGSSGFFSLALEVLWFRMVDVAVRSTAFTFGSVLSIYLLGLGVGVVGGSYFLPRLRTPLRVFLTMQMLIVTYTGTIICSIILLPTSFPGLSELVMYWQSPDVFELGADWNWSRIGLLYLLFPILLYGPPTVLMGLSFAILQSAVHEDRVSVGRRVGYLQASNIFGNVIGSLLVGLVLMETWGTPNVLRMLMAGGLVFPLLGWVLFHDRFQICGAAIITLMVLIWPSSNRFWSRLHGDVIGSGAFAEDATGLIAVTTASGEGGTHRVSINGKWQSWLPFGGIHSELGAIAAILHPHPKKIAIVGLGSGDTAWASGCRKQTEQILVFEVCGAVQKMLGSIATNFPDLQRMLHDPRFVIHNADGRRFLANSEEKFDIIEADALRPQSAYAGNIFSTEFFRICSARLNPGGLMCQWAPTLRTYYTFAEVFPNVVAIPSRGILIGSNEPIQLNGDSWKQTIGQPDIQSYFGEKVFVEVYHTLSNALPLVIQGKPALDVNRDLFPRDEFLVPDSKADIQ